MADLINYHGDSKVISRLCELVNNMTGINFEVVQTLPTQDISTSTIYLVPKQTAQTDNVYDEYINTDGTSQGWELIGDTEIDLSDYYTKTETDDLLDEKADTSDIKDGTLTIQLNGTTEQTFTANSSTNETANIKAVDWVSNGILGAKNLNAYPPYNETSHTDTGVVFTDNGDGTIKATGKSTSASRSGFVCHSRSVGSVGSFFLKNGTYILTGCPSGGSETSYYIEVGRTVGSNLSRYGRETGDGLVFTVDGDANNTDKAQIQLVCYCYSNYQLPNDGIVFKPMIRLVEDTDNEWQPYTMTNRELTKKANWVYLGSLASAITVDDVYSEYRAIVGITVSGFDTKYFTIDLLPNELTSTEKSFTQCTPCQTQTNLSSTYLAIGGVKAKKENAQVTIKGYGNYGGSISGQAVAVAISGNLYAKA